MGKIRRIQAGVFHSAHDFPPPFSTTFSRYEDNKPESPLIKVRASSENPPGKVLHCWQKSVSVSVSVSARHRRWTKGEGAEKRVEKPNKKLMEMWGPNTWGATFSGPNCVCACAVFLWLGANVCECKRIRKAGTIGS